jgi:hypothetical protein
MTLDTKCCYTECRYAECRYTECRYAECLYAVPSAVLAQCYKTFCSRNLRLLMIISQSALYRQAFLS